MFNPGDRIVVVSYYEKGIPREEPAIFLEMAPPISRNCYYRKYCIHYRVNLCPREMAKIRYVYSKTPLLLCLQRFTPNYRTGVFMKQIHLVGNTINKVTEI